MLGFLFSREGLVDSLSSKEREWTLKSKNYPCVPQGTSQSEEGSRLNVVFVLLIQQQKCSPSAWHACKYKARHLGSRESMFQHKVGQLLSQILLRVILGQWEGKLCKGTDYSGFSTTNDCKKFSRQTFHRTDLAF